MEKENIKCNSSNKTTIEYFIDVIKTDTSSFNKKEENLKKINKVCLYVCGWLFGGEFVYSLTGNIPLIGYLWVLLYYGLIFLCSKSRNKFLSIFNFVAISLFNIGAFFAISKEYHNFWILESIFVTLLNISVYKQMKLIFLKQKTKDGFDILKEITSKELPNIQYDKMTTYIKDENEEITTLKTLKIQKRTFGRFLKYGWLKFKRKIRNTKTISQNENKKQKVEFVLSKNLIFIVVALIIGFSYIFVEQSKINYKEKIRKEEQAYEEKIRQENEINDKKQQYYYEYCMIKANDNYISLWNTNCKSRKLKKDCTLPLPLADSINKQYEKDQKICMDKLKTKAFNEIDAIGIDK